MMENLRTGPQGFDPVQVGKALIQHLERCGHGAVLARADTQESDIARIHLRNLEGAAKAAAALSTYCTERGYQSRLLDLDGKDEESGFGDAKALLGLFPGNRDPNLVFVIGVAAGDSKALERLEPEDARMLGASVLRRGIVNLYAELDLLMGATLRALPEEDSSA